MAVIRSWVESANDGLTDFPLSNLPFGVFRHSSGSACIGVAIGDQILNLQAVSQRGLLAAVGEEVAASCEQDSLNALMALGGGAGRALRARLMELLSEQSARSRIEPLLVSQAGAEMLRPAH